MTIGIASDHAGFRYKELIFEHLHRLGHDVRDFGTFSPESCDYPDFCHPCAAAVSEGELERGIVLGGSGNGEAMVANRHKGVRCAVCWNVDAARLARLHNNANMIALGERMMSPEMAIAIVNAWLDELFEGGRHQPRIEKIDP